MGNIYLCFGLIIGYVILCILYACIGLRNKNVYLRYSIGVFILIHSCAQIYLVYSKWKYVLMQTEKLTLFQMGILVLGIILLIINVLVDRYIINQDKKNAEVYCISHLDELRLIAKEKEVSREIQDLLKYITPKKCDPEDANIEEILHNLTKENMEESYIELKRLVNMREEKLKVRCR